MNTPLADENNHRKWLVCGMLLLALVLNYMDRQTLSLTITAIESEIHTNNEQYGRLEKGFGYAFACGGLAFGLIVDRVSVRWLYPFVLLGWSAAGLATGYADRLGAFLTPLLAPYMDVGKLSLTNDPEITRAYIGFLVCRVTLGFFEAGQWPCALVTTQRLLSRADRSFGNSILQSGASIGAILTPVVITLFAPPTPAAGAAQAVAAESAAAGSAAALAVEYAGWWRLPYVVIGGLGVLWIVPWFVMVWRVDLRRPATSAEPPGGGRAAGERPRADAPGTGVMLFIRRYVALVAVVIVLNLMWQYFRVWLPKMLEQYHGYRPDQVRWFIIAYYIATDVGCLCAGAAVKVLAERGWDIHRSRMAVFTLCAMLTSLSTIASTLPKGPLLLGLFLLIGFGALGLFPNYYSFTQELTARHQGKITGSLGFITWVITSEMQEIVGKVIDRTQSYASGIFWIGLSPLLGVAAMLLLWGRVHDSSTGDAR